MSAPVAARRLPPEANCSPSTFPKMERVSKGNSVTLSTLYWYLPDYVVYDQTLENKRGFRVLGATRRYLTAGTFNNRWRVPHRSRTASSRAP